MAIGNIDLNQEIESWKSAVYGKDVRSANVAAFEKIQGTVNDTVQNVNQAAEDSASAAHNAQAAVDSIQAAIVTATEKAAAAATSATQAAGSQAAADSSKTAAAQSETNAAASAAEARQIAEGFGGFDGTAASVKATDTYGLVVDALGESTAQALIDAVANKVMNELVAKSQILNNLLATVPGNALDAVQGKNLQDQITQLNGDLSGWKLEYIVISESFNLEPKSKIIQFGYGYGSAANSPWKNNDGFTITIWVAAGMATQWHYANNGNCYNRRKVDANWLSWNTIYSV